MQIKRRSLFKVLLLVIIFGIIAALWFWKLSKKDGSDPGYITEIIDKGDIVQNITANGTLNPVTLVNVGTQISGTVQKLYVDFNDRVNAGKILAELDPSLLVAQCKQDQANLDAARASLRLAELKEARTRALVEKKFLASQELDQALQTTDAAKAQVKLSEAQLQRSQANLGYSVIRSPVSGVVVARNVDLGQTVAASFQTPTLFQIAQDLKLMQIDTTVAEADIGNVRLDQTVTFTVDAFPNQTFNGHVKQIRLNPIVSQNVVSYDVVVSADNADGKLMPGMTAHVNINANQRHSVLRVPNAAIRFKPDQDSAKEQNKSSATRVFKLVEGNPQAIPIQIGISDSSYSEVIFGDLQVGDEIILRSKSKSKKPDSSSFRMRIL